MASMRRFFLSVQPSLITARSLSFTYARTASTSSRTTIPHQDLGVGEITGAEFKIEPLRRDGEDLNTIRARLQYQCRKRGTLESDLLMSTFAEAQLRHMTKEQLVQLDLFLDENDWDIYYWATQEPPFEPQEATKSENEGILSSSTSQDKVQEATNRISEDKQSQLESNTDAWRNGEPRSGEWPQTVGTFKPEYRPIPARWRDSEILALLRTHVRSRSAGGTQENSNTCETNTGGALLYICVWVSFHCHLHLINTR
ncbi:BgTH12-03623 [Blumeria graminis f. sp. triticale]|uniref:Succinate dehydrogenase assembly factor 2, mitochondrial n=3 Tax=Blumeria graminis TaxID=34373 RepID=A0A061HFM4_BLUGR|nr:hypothetical protein BGT96224_3335 [Blumeria graminis f. sp. tritici 96224]CAD6499511.1 BgTH12-03623 [Blumeria graminis f. sp. triticale]VCU39676.1 Bgt-3335 [Blumeria graminis f. sp. tritici]